MFEQLFEKGKVFFREHQSISVAFGAILSLSVVYLLWTQVFTPQKTEASPDLALASSQLVKNSQNSSYTSKGKQPSTTKTQTFSDKIWVDIKGAVSHEGVYQMSADSRVADAIQLAGGLTQDADKKSINLAQKVSDEEVVYVASVGENISVITKQSQTDNASSSDSSQSAGTNRKINLNEANAEDLQTISGIGQKRAEDIIAYRDSNGGFSSIDELKNISGIGDKTFDKLKDEVSLD